MTSPHILSWQGQGLKLNERADVETLLEGIDPTVITEVHFGGNTLGVGASEALADFLAKATSIQIADFSDIFTGRLISEIPLALTALCDALIDKTSLVEINLNDNAFGGRSVDPIVPLLSKNRNIRILKLNNNGLGPAGGTVIANALLESAKLSKAEGKPSNLRIVICGRNRLENGSASAWAEAFAAHGNLEEVRMIQNGIWMDGITALAGGLSQNPRLQHIDLQDNTFTSEGDPKGLQAWADALTSWPDLHTLNLSDCVLSGEGEIPTLLTTLAEGSNPKLHTLSLQNNNLETQSFALLSKNIQENLKSLMRLELQMNDGEEDDEHLEAIGESLKQRGGKLLFTDEDEEEDEREREREREREVEVEAADKEPATPALAHEVDDLADMLSKAAITS